MHNRMMVTGAGSGLGREIALRWAREGWQLALSDVNEAGLAETLALVREAGGDGFTQRCDVRDYSQLIALAQACETKLGGIDVVVNNAGVASGGFFEELSLEDWEWQISINLMGVVKGCKAFLPLLQRSQGKIINVASVAGLYGNAGQMNYSASKAAIIGMTKTTAKELGSRGITCNAVAPGFISTPMTDKLSDEVKNSILSMIAMKRYGEVNEIAGVVSFLASPDASYVTGQVIEISGGLSM